MFGSLILVAWSLSGMFFCVIGVTITQVKLK